MVKIILIVEDEPATVEALRDVLLKNDFDILEAGNGKQGLEIALKEHPDLILLDILMPEMDGLTMLKQLRQDSWGQNAPVILLTNVSDPARVMEAMQQGAYDYLIKGDWDMEKVVEKIKKKLGVE